MYGPFCVVLSTFSSPSPLLAHFGSFVLPFYHVSLFVMKSSSSIVLSFALQLFLADLVLAQTSSLSQAFTTFNSVPTQTGLANSYHDPGDNSDSGDATSLFPTRCLACPIPSSSASLLASSSASSLTASPSSTSSGAPALINSPNSDPSSTIPAS
ncbi:hypothetical protein C8R46DRAFT_112982 [Mycena filopes]|nr:hypothetical protein C8R46DRAFT_112982 [Mycena filopes]